MNQELFDSMRKQMTPSPEVRAALSEKLVRPAKKRPGLWKKYGTVAACAALVIGTFTIYSYSQESDQWMFFLRSFNRSSPEAAAPMHSYVMADGLPGYVREDAAAAENTMTGGGDTGHETGGLPNRDHAPSGALPGGAYIGDVPVQEGAEDYQKLMDRFNGTYPDWYGGAYIDDSGRLVVQLVEDKDPADKSLELQVLDWTGSDHVMFSSCKYSLAHLKGLMDRLNALPDEDMKCGDVMAGWGIDEEANRIELTLTQVNDHILSVLAELDPEDDAIYVQVGQRQRISTDTALAEEPASHDIMPGGATAPVPEDDAPIAAVEPWYYGVRDGAHYSTEDSGSRSAVYDLDEDIQHKQ